MLEIEQIKKILLKFDDFVAQGYPESDAAAKVEIKLAQIKRWKQKEDDFFSVPGPWQLTYKGKTWKDMPAPDTFSKRCQFALFRRDKLVLNAYEAMAKFRKRGRPSKEQVRARKDEKVIREEEEEEFDLVPDEA